MKVSAALNDYLIRKPGVSMLSARQYTMTVDQLDRWNGTACDLSRLDVERISLFMRHLMSEGRTGRTANNKRAHLLTIWKHAWKRGFTERRPPDVEDLPKVPEIRRRPTAWDPEQMETILDACLSARTLYHPSGKQWTGQQWAALVSVAYDTCRRIGSLLSAKRSDLDLQARTLFIGGENEKGKADSLTTLSERSIRLIRQLPETPLLFDWPYADRIQKYYERDVLKPAGLPHGRRDKFHRVRRTSYTYVAKELGIAAASEHASHKSNLSQSYLDTTKLDRPNPLSVLPELRCG